MGVFERVGVYFWPVGTADSTTIVVDDAVTMQVDLHHMIAAEGDGDDATPIVDILVDELPRRDGKPYLSAFALTHPDKDHILGFADLLERVTIGELWFTPRVFREHQEELCDDAVAFREEARRRVAVTIKADGDPGSGDRVQLFGYDELLDEERYKGFPRELLTIPGNAVTRIDGEDRNDAFYAFIHAPFKDDGAAERNETSLAMRVVLGGDPQAPGVLLLGDVSYPTLRRIVDESKAHGNEIELHWAALLSPHHCSKSAMYQKEGDKLVLKRDILEDLEAAQAEGGRIIASSRPVPASNQVGDNPPHAKAKARYQEITDGGFLCTHEDGAVGEPLVFVVGTQGGLTYEGLSTVAATDPVDNAIIEARGSDEPPTDKVGFGR
ncbi:hypothetical protein [Parvularcula oceani]|uniref:hypothetical protein n=1 Tax=Parvularcula oceani TaxID=1247963 RepID=UPI0004E1DEA9|nr:hypothetical protein [Parvularcula oceani]